MAPSRYDWKIVDWDVKPQHNQPTNQVINKHFSVPSLQMPQKALSDQGLLCVHYIQELL